jgi:hypothetical protein
MKARVGRHARTDGRHCQNWADDQKTIMDLLNRIPASAGGAGGSISERIVGGICGDTLYGAILRFEDKHFGTQHSGYVDPGGKMLELMEKLAASPGSAPASPVAAPKPAVETSLDILRRNVLNIDSVVAKFHGDNVWTAGDRVQLDRLIQLAVNHIDRLKSIKDPAGHLLVQLPWWGEVFGRVSLDPGPVIGRRDSDILMKYGAPLRFSDMVQTTSILPALLLFADGYCFPLRPGHYMNAAAAHEHARSGFEGV